MTGLLPGPTRQRITGLVLSGGRGLRMSEDGQGLDKGLQPLHGRPLVSHVITRLAPQVGSLLVNANRNFPDYARFGHPVVPDQPAGFAGPLAGLQAGLLATGTPWLVTAPCDTPFLPDDLVARLWLALHGAAPGRAQAAVAGTPDGRRHPVFALVNHALQPALARYLADGGRKVDDWLEQVGAVTVLFDDVRAFENLNTRQALARIDAPPLRPEADAKLP